MTPALIITICLALYGVCACLREVLRTIQTYRRLNCQRTYQRGLAIGTALANDYLKTVYRRGRADQCRDSEPIVKQAITESFTEGRTSTIAEFSNN